MMSENGQERRPIVITSNLKILVIVIVTIALTFLFIRSNQTMVNTPTLVKTMYDTDAGLMANNSEHRLVFPAVNVSLVTNSTKDIVVDHPFPQKQDSVLRNNQEVALSVTKEQTLNTNLQDIKEFRSEKTGLIQDDYFLVKPNLYWNKLNGYNITNKTIDKNMSVYNMEDNQSEVTAKNGMYQMDPGSNSINREYSTIDVNIPLSEENDLNSLYNVNDSSYNSGSYGYKEIGIPVDGIKLVTDGQSEQINTIENIPPSGSGSNAYYRPHSNHDFKARYPTGQAIYYRPSATIPMKKRQPSKNGPDEEYYKPIPQQLLSNISLKNNSALLLIILGILKLKLIGILQIIFLLGFKLKLFLIAIFTKFLLVTKLVKFFKIIMLPVILLSSLSVFASMFNGTNNTLASSSTQSSLLNMLLPSSFNNMEESSSSGSSSSSSSSSSPASGSFSGGSSSSSSTIPSDIPPDILELLSPGLSQELSGRLYMDILSCNSSGILLPDLSPDGTIRSEIVPPYFTSKVQDSNIFSRQQYKSVKSLDPTSTISPKILDSEKCVERIACRLAVAEKAGIIPLWVKLRILNGVSKLIPEEKYELYFKTYNFVNNEIETTKMSLTPENWAEWC